VLARRLSGLCLISTLFALAVLPLAPLHAQNGGVVPQAINGLDITPDGGTMTVLAGSTGNEAVFWAHNGLTTSGSYTFACSGAKITCVSVTPSSATIAAGGGREISVIFNAVNFNTGGSLVLTANPSGETGSISVTIQAVGAPSAVTLRNQNADNIDRSACLTSGAGEAAAWSCGDLAVAHAMPAYTAMNRARNLTLIYNSAQAVPQPVVAVAVTESGISRPDFVYAELKVNGAVKAVNTYAGWVGAPTTRQLALSYDASADSSGIYPFTFEVRNQYVGGGSFSKTVSGNLIVVNRKASRYGRGWRPVGIEELRTGQAGEAILWVGGDASAKVYNKLNDSTWLAAPGGYRDTLQRSDTIYTRTLRHGVKVKFDGHGRHTQTISRTGQTTTVTYNPYGQVNTIAVPPGGAGNTYTFSYGAADSLLDKIADPGSRVLDVTVNPTSRALTMALDPDSKSTTFAYDTPGRMVGRTGRRGFRTEYTYLHGLRVTRVAVPINPAAADSAITGFSPWDELGLQNLTPIDTAQVFTTIVGPRVGVPDDAKIWVDRWGAPTKIVDPIGAATTLVRADTIVPLMVTQVTFPNPAGGGTQGRFVTMTYDSLANLTQVRDNTSHLGTVGMPTKVTRYLYQDPNAPFSPNKVIDSIGSQARVATYTYTAQGLTNDALDPRGHRTIFGYTSDGLVNRVTEVQVETWHEGVTNDTLATKQDQVWTFDYDAKRNLKVDTTATKVVHAYVRDAVGRVTDVYDPLSTRMQRMYDPMDRDTVMRQYTTRQIFPYSINPLLSSRCDATQVLCSDPTVDSSGLAATLDARKLYGAMTLDTVADSRNVRRDFAYDARSLVTRERDDFGMTQQFFMGKSGLLDSTLLRSSARVTYAYDPAGRRTMMRFPQNVYNNGAIIPGDSIRYTYDTLGNQLTATSVNRGSITRTYYANGLLKSNTSTSGFTDVISYSYDQAWGLTRVIHNADTTDYTYSATTGDLQTVTVRLGITGTTAARTRTFSYLWDGLGRLRQITYPGTSSGPMTVSYRYDAAGILRRLKSVNPKPGNDIFDLTLRNKSVDATGRILKQDLVCPVGNVTGDPCGLVNNRFDSVGTANAYDRMGALAVQNRNGWIDTMRYDASGNMIYRKDGQLGLRHTYVIDALHNRLVRDQIPSFNDLFVQYDSNGSRVTEMGNIVDLREKHYYYDGLGRMTGTFVWVGTDTHDNPNDCKYDADGQMVAGCEGAPWLGFDGDNVSGVLFAGGKGWTFFHGPGLDTPLMGYYRPTTGLSRVFYWVTDGNGRELAVADSAGLRQSTDQGPDIGTWRQAGGIANSYTFSSDRQDNAVATNLSFFRNRVYDQNTGRWLQEDPIGVAGGLNLYQFNGNDPVTFTDPFGLSVCSDLREEIDNNAEQMKDYKKRYQEHINKGDGDTGHEEAIRNMERRHDKLMRRYKQNNCGDEDDHDNWNSQAEAIRAIPVPAPQIVQTHGYKGRPRQMSMPQMTPAQVNAVGAVSVSVLLMRLLAAAATAAAF